MKELNIEVLENIVPERIFWRGEDLYNEGAVKKVEITGDGITAEVMGTRPYKVRAEFTDDDFHFLCNCPYEGFCKHSIALGFWMVNNISAVSQLSETGKKHTASPDAASLIKRATAEQKDKFLLEALNESSILLNRFEILLKGSVNVGMDVEINALVAEISAKLENFDLNDYSRFYDSAPERFGYREEWEILREGAEEEFNSILDPYRDKMLELLKIRNINGAFKYLLSIYEAAKTADYERNEDPACIFEGDGLHYVADEHLNESLQEFLDSFRTISLEEDEYIKLMEICFDRLTNTAQDKVYQITDFTEILLASLITENTAVKMEKLLKDVPNLQEEEYCELLLAVYEKKNEKENWLNTAQKYYQANEAVAEKLLHHYAEQNDKLTQLAQNIAFSFNNKFIPFFYQHLKKADAPQLYKEILAEHTRKMKTLELYHEFKNEYGPDAAMNFIDSLDGGWDTEQFYIRLLKEEKAYERLLSIAQKKSVQSPAMAWLRPIVNIYPDQVFKIISKRTEHFLEVNIGRNYYREVAEWLKLLKQITDDAINKKSRDFINRLMDKYKNRPALKDEFRKAGLGL